MCGGDDKPNPHTGSTLALSYLVGATCGDVSPGIPLSMVSVHVHEDGSAGVSDLIGYRLDAARCEAGKEQGE